MSRRKPVHGVCKLCRKHDKLHFEHIPPQSAFNKTTKFRKTTFGEALASKDIFEPKLKGPVYQGGIGINAYCERCNNFLGSYYDPTYKEWAYLCAEALRSEQLILNRAFNFNYLAKRAISHFIALDSLNLIPKEFEELISYVRDPELLLESRKYRLWCYLNSQGVMRPGMFQTITTPFSRTPINAFEFAFPPCGFVLTIDYFDKIPGLVDISRFLYEPTGTLGSIVIRMRNLPTYSIQNLDYRLPL